MKRFKDWLIGKTQRKPTSIIGIGQKVLTGSLFLYLIFTFTSGPGAVFAAFTPIGYKSKNLGKTIIHYQQEFEPNLDYYIKVIEETRETNNHLWNQGVHNIIEKEGKMHFYLCLNTDAAAKLTMIKSPAITVFGNKIVLAQEFIEQLKWEIPDVLRHEISHVNAASRYGWLRNYYHVPIWLDEGIASNMSNFWQHSYDHFISLLNQNPKITSLTKLNNLMDWNNGFVISRDNYLKQYGYSLLFTKDLIENIGFDNVKTILINEKNFAILLGKNLYEYEIDWIAKQKRLHVLPEATELQYPSVPLKITILWIIQSILIIGTILYMILWSVRQIFKILRYISVMKNPIIVS